MTHRLIHSPIGFGRGDDTGAATAEAAGFAAVYQPFDGDWFRFENAADYSD